MLYVDRTINKDCELCTERAQEMDDTQEGYFYSSSQVLSHFKIVVYANMV